MHILPHAVSYLSNVKLSFTGKWDSDIYSGHCWSTWTDSGNLSLCSIDMEHGEGDECLGFHILYLPGPQQCPLFLVPIICNGRDANIWRMEYVQFVCMHPHSGLGCDGVGGQAEGLCTIACSNIHERSNWKRRKRVFAVLTGTLSTVRAPVKDLLQFILSAPSFLFISKKLKKSNCSFSPFLPALPPLLLLCPQVTLMWAVGYSELLSRQL